MTKTVSPAAAKADAGGSVTPTLPLESESRARGLEPLTFGSVDRCSIQLSYARLIDICTNNTRFLQRLQGVSVSGGFVLPCIGVRRRAGKCAGFGKGSGKALGGSFRAVARRVLPR